MQKIRSMHPALMRTIASRSRVILSLLGLAAAGGIACRADSIVSLSAGERNRHITASVGERIDVTLQTVGGGEYASPPAVSSPAVAFLDAGYCGNPVPAGPTQCFHFRAVASGRALLTFTHTENNAPVKDTVDVR